jgi:hypothetical protein
MMVRARAAVATGTWLSMTALASWCVGDTWIDEINMPVDEVVPMVFTMGRGTEAVLNALRTRREFRAARCRESVGWAVGEPVVVLHGARRRYVFNARPWSAQDATPWLNSR